MQKRKSENAKSNLQKKIEKCICISSPVTKLVARKKMLTVPPPVLLSGTHKIILNPKRFVPGKGASGLAGLRLAAWLDSPPPHPRRCPRAWKSGLKKCQSASGEWRVSEAESQRAAMWRENPDPKETPWFHDPRGGGGLLDQLEAAGCQYSGA